MTKEDSLGGVSVKQYLALCKQLGREPDPKKLPKTIHQFPHIVQVGIRVFRKLPDLYISLGMEGSMFVGKNYSSILDICKLYNITDEYELMITMFVCENLESIRVEKEAAAVKASRKK